MEESTSSTTRAKITKDNKASRDMGFHEGGYVRTMTSNLELIPAPQPGDRVVIKYAGWEGKTGKVHKQDGSYFYIDVDNGGYLVLCPSEFNVVPVPLKQEDFKEGMTVKVTNCPVIKGKTGKVQPNIGGRYIVVLIDGKREYLLPTELEIIEEKENKVVTVDIKVGDKVQVDMDTPTASFHGVEGIVEEITPGKSSGYIRITKSNSKVAWDFPAGTRTYLYGLTKKDFKVGDKVRYVGNDNADTFDKNWVGIEGEVTEVHTNIVYMTITKPAKVNSSTYKVGFEIYPSKQNLELIVEEEPFTFKDIQKGDKIKRTRTYPSGSVEVREGVIEGYNGLGGYWTDGASFILAYETDNAKDGVILELLDRPKEPELWENRKAGDKIATYSTQDGTLERLFTKREDGLWDTLVVNTIGALQKGFERSDEDVALHITKHSKAAKAHLVK